MLKFPQNFPKNFVETFTNFKKFRYHFSEIFFKLSIYFLKFFEISFYVRTYYTKSIQISLKVSPTITYSNILTNFTDVCIRDSHLLIQQYIYVVSETIKFGERTVTTTRLLLVRVGTAYYLLFYMICPSTSSIQNVGGRGGRAVEKVFYIYKFFNRKCDVLFWN